MQALRERLPPTWRVSEGTTARAPVLRLSAPDGQKLVLSIEWAPRLEPRDAKELARDIRERTDSANVVVAAPFLSARTREVLDGAELPYFDLTGNALMVFDRPGLFIQTTGATKDPRREERPARSLKGDKASRVIRLLLDSKRPLGVRALAEAAGVDAGYVSRVLTLLDRQALIERDSKGSVLRIDWMQLLRRWAEDAPLSSRGPSETFIDPRGLPNVLRGLRMNHAITGSLAAAKLAPIAPARLAVIYVNDIADAAELLGLRPTDTGVNVMLIAPRDRFVFERTVERGGVTYAAPSQVAADLLSSPGRGPAEADEIIEWMGKHEEEWRG